MLTTSKRRVDPKTVDGKLVLMHRYLKILLELYPNKSFNQQDLANLIGENDSNLKGKLEELEKANLVTTQLEKGKGKERKKVWLTDRCIEALTTLKRGEESNVGLLLTPQDDYIESTVALLEKNKYDKKEDPEIRLIAAAELVNISQKYIISPDSRLFKYLKSIDQEEDTTVLVDILTSLNTMMGNSPYILIWVRENLKEPLETISTRTVEKEDYRVPSLALRILVKVFEDEERYKKLIDLYEKYLTENIVMARTTLGLIVELYPEKRSMTRLHLIKLFKNSSKEIRLLLQEHLTQF